MERCSWLAGCDNIAIERYVEMCEHEHWLQGFTCAEPRHRVLPLSVSARCKECKHVCRGSRKVFELEVAR